MPNSEWGFKAMLWLKLSDWACEHAFWDYWMHAQYTIKILLENEKAILKATEKLVRQSRRHGDAVVAGSMIIVKTADRKVRD